MIPTVNTLAKALLDGLFPNYCCLCQQYCPGALPLCPECRPTLMPNSCSCVRCALPLPSGLPVQTPTQPATATPVSRRLCGNCLQQPPPFDRVLAPYIYDEQLAFLIRQWKYRRQQWLTPLLADLWLTAAPGAIPPDLLVPVPLHWRKLWQRGFNQATLLASELQARSPALAPARLATRSIRRQRATAAQSGMSAARRVSNLRRAFTVDLPCDNLRIAIVDDVLTTGATAGALAHALRAVGAVQVEVWCIARTPAPKGPGA